MTTVRTLADPMFASIFNKGEPTMNDIICETTEEYAHPSTTIISNPTETGHPVPNQTQPVQGVSGASYAPMDTSPVQTNPQLTHLFKQLQDTITAIIQLSTTHQQTQAQTDLEQAVDTALEQAQWFKDRIEENCADAIENHDFDYEIGQNVESYMRNAFDANDHVDFEALVKERVEDELESIIDGLVEEAVEARLADLLEEKLKNANITVSF